MNPVGEEVGQTARSFIDALRGQPLGLSMVVINLAMVAIFWMIISHAFTRGSEREEMMYKEQKEIRDLLSKCMVPSEKT